MQKVLDFLDGKAEVELEAGGLLPMAAAGPGEAAEPAAKRSRTDAGRWLVSNRVAAGAWGGLALAKRHGSHAHTARASARGCNV